MPSAGGLDMMWTPVTLSNGMVRPYGFGWQIDQQNGHKRIGHGGAWQGFRTMIARYPEYNLTVIVLGNSAQATSDVMAAAIAGILEPDLYVPAGLRN